MNEITLAIVGSGGDGAVAAGDILAMACARNGLHVIKTEAYGPQIRGGESSCTVRVSARPIVLHDADDPPPAEVTGAIAVPFTKLAREAGAPSGKNVLALGILGALL